MYCDNCGAENRDGANFCHNCGQGFSHIAAGRKVAVSASDPVSPSPVIETSTASERSSGILNGRYELKEMLGRGGMGVIYRAHDQHLGMDVAIKFLRESLASNFAAVDASCPSEYCSFVQFRGYP
jgi:serine/threonine protein kinase